ncbi:MAG TPA: SpoIID/LytB domain-containing protein [Acidimicrobiales bacterium]|jgi:stage II sporulation protein D|nr:SpoIID/LytB domain-containing protein [Acidimicrobiales bacterium]
MARVIAAFITAAAVLAAVATPAAAASTGPVSAGELTLVPAAGTTLSVDGIPYAGSMVVAADPGGGIDVVDRVSFEDYVDGIGEMPSSWPAAALQAQAVAARTYALWTVLTHPAGPGGGQICATDSCQVYFGLDKLESQDGAQWAAAVKATSGAVLQYQGRIIEALYGSSDGGQTVDGGVPWLPSVSDPQDSLSPEHNWTWSEPLSAMAGTLGVPAGQTLVSLVSSTTAIQETLGHGSGPSTSVSLTPGQFHSLVNARTPNPSGLDLPLPSYRYSVSTYGTTVKIAGMGDGNGYGMSQYGALGKAQAGWTAGQILADYYAGTVAGPLPANEMPATIGVTLHSGTGHAGISANGPVSIVDGRGTRLADVKSAAAWSATRGGAGVELSPSGAIAEVDPDIPVAAPVAPRAPGPTGAGSTVAAGRHHNAPPAPTTTRPAPAPAVSRPPAPTPSAVAAAETTARPKSGGIPWNVLIGTGVVIAGAAVIGHMFRRRRGERPAGQ